MEWLKVGLIQINFQLVKHVYVMLKHVLCKPGVIDIFHNSHFDMK